MERELDAARVLDAARPQVVFHCAALRVGRVLNRDDYLWRKLVRSTSALSPVLPKHPVESLVFVALWDHTEPEELAAHLSAAAEISVLNSSGFLSAAPKVIRLPSILTAGDLARVMTRQQTSEASYSLLEGEAIALCLDAAANYKGRVVLIPRDEPPVDTREIRAILSRGSVVHRLSTRSGGEALTLFPNEETKVSIIRGAREVLSPIYPAGDELLRSVQDCVHSFQIDLQKQSGLHTALFERARVIRSSTR
jgi:hypothetical protein